MKLTLSHDEVQILQALLEQIGAGNSSNLERRDLAKRVELAAADLLDLPNPNACKRPVGGFARRLTIDKR